MFLICYLCHYFKLIIFLISLHKKIVFILKLMFNLLTNLFSITFILYHLGLKYPIHILLFYDDEKENHDLSKIINLFLFKKIHNSLNILKNFLVQKELFYIRFNFSLYHNVLSNF